MNDVKIAFKFTRSYPQTKSQLSRGKIHGQICVSSVASALTRLKSSNCVNTVNIIFHYNLFYFVGWQRLENWFILKTSPYNMWIAKLHGHLKSGRSSA